MGDMIQGRPWSVIMAVRSQAALLQGRMKTSGIMTTAEHEKHVHKHTKTHQYNPPAPSLHALRGQWLATPPVSGPGDPRCL